MEVNFDSSEAFIIQRDTRLNFAFFSQGNGGDKETNLHPGDQRHQHWRHLLQRPHHFDPILC